MNTVGYNVVFQSILNITWITVVDHNPEERS